MNTVTAAYASVSECLASFGLACKRGETRTRYAALPERTANVPGAVEALKATAATLRKAHLGAEAMVFELAAQTLKGAVLVPFRVMLRP